MTDFDEYYLIHARDLAQAAARLIETAEVAFHIDSQVALRRTALSLLEKADRLLETAA